MPRIPDHASSSYTRLLADLLLNELLGLRNAGDSYELWWVEPHPQDDLLDLTGRGRFVTLWPDMPAGPVTINEALRRILTLNGHVNIICAPFSQAFTRSDILAGPEALVNRLRLEFPNRFQVYTVPRITPEQRAWIGQWGAVVDAAWGGAGCGGAYRYVADPTDLNRLQAKCRSLAAGRATAFPEPSFRRITTGELDMMRAVIRRSGRYVDVERLLHQTVNSLLYRAVDTQVGNEPVIIKVMLAPWGAEQARRREAIARRLGHPNIVRIYEPETFHLDDGRALYAVVMEYMPGGSLKDELARKGRLPLRRALEIAIQVCEGLAYAHEQGIVHRDIKPGNILLSARGEVKIADFNIAKIPGISGETQSGRPLGTLHYIPPEQIERAHQATPKADIYSLGCVLFEMLVGRPPFQAETDREMAMHHQQTPPPSIRAYRPEVPTVLEELIHRCMVKDPDKRPSAHELAKALREIQTRLFQEET